MTGNKVLLITTKKPPNFKEYAYKNYLVAMETLIFE